MFDCGCSCDYGDYDAPEFFNIKEVKARIPHFCSECGEVIEKGTGGHRMTPDRCPCGDVIYANTEDWETPICYECYIESQRLLIEDLELTVKEFEQFYTDILNDDLNPVAFHMGLLRLKVISKRLAEVIK